MRAKAKKSLPIPVVNNSSALAHLELLAETCAEAGRFADAFAVIQKAIALAEANHQTDALLKDRELLEQYRQRFSDP